ncbi:MAG TPA: hypothetical protein PKJ05_02495 [Bacillota bacterium]|nr:hypothetical protein [Bacillota bacterium]
MNPARQYFALVKALLKVNFNIGFWKASLKKKLSFKVIGQAFLYLLLAAIAGFYEVMFILLLKKMYPVLAMAGQQSSMLTLGISAAQIMVLIFGMFYVLAAFYYAKGTSQLMAMPMNPVTVLMGKFTVVLVNEYLTELLILGPIMGVYGFMSGAGLPYWLMCALVFLMVPLLPLAMASILAMLMAGIIARGRNRTATNILGVALFLALYFGFQYLVLFKLPQDGSSMVNYLASANYQLAQTASRNFPPSLWGTYAVAEGFNSAGLKGLALFAGSALLGVALIMLLGSKFYYNVVMKGTETSTNRNRLEAGEALGKLRQGDPIATIASKDHKIVMRTSVYLMNICTMPLIWTGLILFYYMFGKNIASSQPEDQVIQFVMNFNYPWLKAIAWILIMQITVSSMMAATAFSREGQSLAITKVLPISGRQVVFAKIRHAVIFQLVSSIPMTMVLQYLFKIPLAYALTGIAVGQVSGLWSIFGGMLIDLARPYLNWTDPTRAVKQNINAVIPLFGGFGLVFAQGYAAYKMLLAGWQGWLPVGVISGFNVLLAVITFAALMAFAEKGYERIEI